MSGHSAPSIPVYSPWHSFEAELSAHVLFADDIADRGFPANIIDELYGEAMLSDTQQVFEREDPTGQRIATIRQALRSLACAQTVYRGGILDLAPEDRLSVASFAEISFAARMQDSLGKALETTLLRRIGDDDRRGWDDISSYDLASEWKAPSVAPALPSRPRVPSFGDRRAIPYTDRVVSRRLAHALCGAGNLAYTSALFAVTPDLRIGNQLALEPNRESDDEPDEVATWEIRQLLAGDRVQISRRPHTEDYLNTAIVRTDVLARRIVRE